MPSEATKVKRLERCELLITSLKNRAAGRISFFYDEIFCVDTKLNCKNDRWLCKDPDDVPVIDTTNFQAGVHVLEVISSEGDIMPSHFFGKGQNMTAAVQWNCLRIGGFSIPECMGSNPGHGLSEDWAST